MPGRSKTMRRSKSRSHSRSMKGGEGEERAAVPAVDPVASQDSGAAAPTPVAQAGGRRRRHSRTAKRSRSRSHSRSHSRSRRGGFGGLVAMAKEALVPFGLFYLQKRTQRRSKH